MTSIPVDELEPVESGVVQEEVHMDHEVASPVDDDGRIYIMKFTQLIATRGDQVLT